METTLTKENLQRILFAMMQIKEIDQSQYFKNYYNEVIERIARLDMNEQVLALEQKRKDNEMSYDETMILKELKRIQNNK